MKFPTLFQLFIAIAICYLLTTSAAAQSGFDSYTSIDYDEDTNTVIAYSETDGDYDLQGEYRAKVNLYVSNEYGTVVASGIAFGDGDGIASIELDFAGEAGRTYTAVGIHSAYVYLYDYDDYAPYERFYYDNWYFTGFEGQNIYQPWYYYFTRPSYNYYLRRSQIIALGRTYDSDSTTTPPACGDERDTIIREYKTYRVALNPTCSFFTQSRNAVGFPFTDLNTGDYSWALIRDPLIVGFEEYGLIKWDFEYGGEMNVNSAYRNPSRNSRVGGARQSRHMYGDAVDIRNETRSMDEYDERVLAARQADADYIEPWTGPCGNGCVHADWRSHTGSYY